LLGLAAISGVKALKRSDSADPQASPFLSFVNATSQ